MPFLLMIFIVLFIIFGLSLDSLLNVNLLFSFIYEGEYLSDYLLYTERSNEFNRDINMFAEKSSTSNPNDIPDNFMDLSSSSEKIDPDKIKDAIKENRKLNPESGLTKSSTIPQTEFEAKPYKTVLLPKSESDPVTLGKNK